MATTSEIIVKNARAAQIIKGMFLNEKYADVYFTFNSDGTRLAIPAHKNILASWSKVFEAMFYGGTWMEQNNVEIVDASFDGFKEFIKFIYLDEFKLSMAKISEVMYLANKYDVVECLVVCEKSLIQNMTLNEICIGLDLAVMFNLSELKNYCVQRISDKTNEVLVSEAFLNCSRHSLKCILEIDDIKCQLTEVFDACVAWGRNACEKNQMDASIMENLRSQLGDCLYDVPFELMEQHQITECVKKNKGFFTADELEELLSMSLLRRFPLKIFKRKRTSNMCSFNLKDINDAVSSHNFSLQKAALMFGVNKTMEFVAISFSNVGGPLLTAIQNMVISEHNDGSHLLQQQISYYFEENNQERFIKLQKPILVEPKIIYGIKIGFDVEEPLPRYSFVKMSSYPRVSVGENEVYFHNKMKGALLISCLHFNLID